MLSLGLSAARHQRATMNRNDKVLHYLNVSGHGIEIGPSHNPIVPKKAGYKVQIIDHLSREQLIAKYQDHALNLDNIEEVDFVWNGESYAELTGKNHYYDWIIASHAIEHTPDLISFLTDCDAILKEEGVLSLVVPDKRYCFDHYRPITGLATIINSHLQRPTVHSPGAVAEYFLNVVSKAGSIAWDETVTGEYQFVHTLDNAIQGMEAVIRDQAYLDIHAWCFVPHSFRLIIHDLFSLGLIPLQEVGFFPTVGNEFYITLGRQGKGVQQSRLELLQAIETELRQGTLEPSPPAPPPPRAVAAPAIAPSPPPPPSLPSRLKGRLKRWIKRWLTFGKG